MAEKRDYYEILGVDRNVGDAQISEAYRKLALKYHPDRNPDDDEAVGKFKEAAEAFEVLSHPEKRARYDRYGHAGLEGGGMPHFHDVSDIFNAFGDIFGEGLFGEFFGGGRGRRAHGGADIRADVTLELMEAAHGAVKVVRFLRHEACDVCRGTGAKPGSKVEKPRFAGLRPGQKMDTIQLADAFELFKLPRTLGTTATGETVLTAIGRFGPYIKYGAKYVSLKEDDPYTVTLERALEVIAAKVLADANRIIQDFPDEKIQVLNGRYGPYITDTAKNARVPKDRDPKSLSLEECKTLLAAAPAKGTRGRFGRKLPAKAARTDAVEAAATAAAAAAEAKAAKAEARAQAKDKAKAAAKAKPKPKSKAKAKAKAAAKGKAGALKRKGEASANETGADEAPPKMVAAGPGSTKR